ncbi:patatin family protein [Rhodococcus sp. D2-41]|uniref:patatin-like phospholipase family protein n=1 Tax=Speluncibacter jeojiensis TaxID=2710754 RepID=UPI00240F511B|nr:patatin-like phospholipase family protein [Rhodococcus sp. D2-41]MDG3011137.1 patatin family protein [Rhodococcus sp. D2-41]
MSAGSPVRTPRSTGVAPSTAHPVRELITARLASGSRPHGRSDDARLALVIEGGGGRGAYSGGMVLALEQLGLTDCFDDVYGASAGALNGVWLLARDAAAGMSIWWDPAVIRRVTNFWSPLRGRPVVDNEYLVDTVCHDLVPLDCAAVLAHPVRFHPLATCVDTGESVDLHAHLADQDSLRRALRASAGMPLLSGRPVPVGGRRFLDAGISQPVPVHTAVADGATHVLVLRTRISTQVPEPIGPLQRRFMRAHLARKAPGTVEVWSDRFARECADERFFAEHDANPLSAPSVLQIRPPDSASRVLRNDRDATQLRRAVEIGRRATLAAFEASVPHSGSRSGRELACER